MTSIYGAVVLEHFKRPRNQRTLLRPTVTHEGYNHLCGDRVRLELDVHEGTIRDAAFTANACAVCTASASLLTERVKGATIEGALALSEEDFLAALEAPLPAARKVCGTLPLRALRDALATLMSSA